jgi:hypothetical protein
MSLVNHLAIEVLHRGVGEGLRQTLMDESIFFVHEFCRAGYDLARTGLVDAAIEAYRRTIAVGSPGAFRADEAACRLFCEIVAVLDRQFERIPVYVWIEANGRLARIEAQGN